MEVQSVARALAIDEHLQAQNLRRLRSMRKRWRPEAQVVAAARDFFDRVRNGLGNAARRGARGYCRWFQGDDDRITDTVSRALPDSMKKVWKDTDDRILHKLEYRTKTNPVERTVDKVNTEQFEKWMHSIDPMTDEDIAWSLQPPSAEQLQAFEADIKAVSGKKPVLAALPGGKQDKETREMLKFIAQDDAAIKAAMSIVETIESRVSAEQEASSGLEQTEQAYTPPAVPNVQV